MGAVVESDDEFLHVRAAVPSMTSVTAGRPSTKRAMNVE